MSDVFISYSKEDANTARLISEKLGAAGFSVWWDRRIMPGKTWDEVIGASLDTASCVVVLWSKVSVQSRWVREEAERGADRHILVPIFIEKVDPPFGFGRIEAADLSAWKGDATDPEFASVCDAISSFLKAPAKPFSLAKAIANYAPPQPKPQPAAAPPPPQPNPMATVQFFLGRWRADVFNSCSDMTYFPDGSFNGFQTQNIAGFTNPITVFGRWNLQILGPDMFQLQIWYANMTSWAGTFRILDFNRIQNLEANYIAFRVQ